MNIINHTKSKRFTKHKFTLLCVLLNVVNIFSQKDGKIDNSFNYEIPNSGNLTECRKIEQCSDGSLLMSGKGFYNVVGWASGAAIEKRTINGALLKATMNEATSVTYSCGELTNNEGFIISKKNDSANVFLYNETTTGVTKRCHLNMYLNVEIFDYKKLSDGSIIACGNCVYMNGEYRFMVIKFTPDFKIDSNFGNSQGGFNMLFGTDAQARAIAIQSDGKIIIVGHEISGNKYNVIMRLTAIGELDYSFFNNGYTRSNVASELYGVKLDKKDNIYAVGTYFQSSIDFGSDIFIIRNGIKLQNYFYYRNYYTIDIDNNGKIYAGGYLKANNYPYQVPVVVRYKPTPTGVAEDTTFEAFGEKLNVFLSNQNNGNSSVYTLKTLTNGSIMVGGINNGEVFIKKLLTGNENNTNTYHIEQNNKFTIYPNPTQNEINVYGNNIEKIEIIDMNGENVFTNYYTDEYKTTLKLENLTNGLYLLKINNTFTQRINKN